MKYLYTTADYIAAIEREQAKRATTYPKIIKKMEKNGADESEIKKVFNAQIHQSAILSFGLDTIRGIYSPETTTYYSIHHEFIREYKMRRKCYPRFIYFQRMTQETADYELAVWRELTIYFAETFPGDAQIALDALETKRRKRNAESNPG